MTGQEIPPFQEGQRVEFDKALAREPHFTVPEGATGVVDYVDESMLSIQMDEPIRGLEPWQNCVEFSADDFTAATAILKVLADR